jgi:hypothetical protein
LIESYGLNDQPACVSLTINERANRSAAEITENLAVNQGVTSANQYTSITKQNTHH